MAKKVDIINVMHWKDLLDGCKQYHRHDQDYDVRYGYYDLLKDFEDSLHLSDEKAERVYNFLKAWGRCRTVSKRQECFPIFVEAYRRLESLVIGLRREGIEGVRLVQSTNVVHEPPILQMQLHFIFDTWSNIKWFGPVATSKVLHLIAPNLIVMWDEDIATELYRIKREKMNGYYYTYYFLPKMQRLLEGAITSYSQENMCDLQTAIASLSKGNHSLAKMMDEFNWVKAHPE